MEVNKKIHRQSSGNIKSRIIQRTIIIMLILGVLITLIILTPMSYQLEESSSRELVFQSRIRALALEQSIFRMKDIAEQVTSRTKIREKLVLYNQGKIPLSELQNFSLPLLNDALIKTPEMKGILRLDRDGKVVLTVGNVDAIAAGWIENLQMNQDVRRTTVQIEGELGRDSSIIVRAAILDRNATIHGVDYVVFDSHILSGIIKDYTALGISGDVLLGHEEEGSFRILNIPRQGVAVIPLASIIEKTPYGEAIVLRGSMTHKLYIVSRAPVRGTDWQLISLMEVREKLAVINNELIVIVLVVTGLIILSVIGVMWLIRPLLTSLHVELESRRNAEQQLRLKSRELEEINTHLEQRVEHEIHKREEHEQLMTQQARMASMGEMLGAIAHQWRQPLNTLSIMVQDVNEVYEAGELDSAYLEKHVRESMELISFMSQTIADFRDFYKPSREKTDVPILSSIRSAAWIISEQLKYHNIHVEIRCLEGDDGCDKLKCPGYPNEFKHVILSILTNSKEAIDDLRDRGIKNARDPGKILIEIGKNRDRSLLIRISDNGGGIPESIIEKVFDSNFTTKEKRAATGTGLYMACMIVENSMHGSIMAKNGEEGAVIEIILPMEAAEQ